MMEEGCGSRGRWCFARELFVGGGVVRWSGPRKVEE